MSTLKRVWELEFRCKHDDKGNHIPSYRISDYHLNSDNTPNFTKHPFTYDFDTHEDAVAFLKDQGMI